MYIVKVEEKKYVTIKFIERISFNVVCIQYNTIYWIYSLKNPVKHFTSKIDIHEFGERKLMENRSTWIYKYNAGMHVEQKFEGH